MLGAFIVAAAGKAFEAVQRLWQGRGSWLLHVAHHQLPQIILADQQSSNISSWS
jgi:hypothetical protein